MNLQITRKLKFFLANWEVVFFLNTLLLVHFHSEHLFDTFFNISGTISEFVAVLQCMLNITPGGSDIQEVETNTMRNELRTHM